MRLVYAECTGFALSLEFLESSLYILYTICVWNHLEFYIHYIN